VNQFWSLERCNQLMVSMQSRCIWIPASGCSATSEGGNQQAKGKRTGKGSHILPIIRKCLKNSENWKASKTTSFCIYVLIHAIRTCTSSLISQCLSKVQTAFTISEMTYGFLRTSRTRIERSKWRVVGKKDNVYYRTAPCIGVKTCTVSGCTYIAPIHEKRPCPHHKNKLVRSEGCPVEFVYVYPEDWQGK